MRSRRMLQSLLAGAAFLSALTASAPRAERTERVSTGTKAAPEARSLDFGAVPEPSAGTLERIRQEREAVLTGTHWTYDSAGRRDPFRSLIENVGIKGEGERPPGIAGMQIGEVDVVGIISSPKGEIVFLNGSDNRGYFLRRGDELYDGKILDIDRAAGRVVFRQEVVDPKEIKPYRDVIKKLYSTTEDGR